MICMPRITRLKEEIVRRRLIQADLAEGACMTESRLSRIVNGRATPTDHERTLLAAALGIEREELPV